MKQMKDSSKRYKKETARACVRILISLFIFTLFVLSISGSAFALAIGTSYASISKITIETVNPNDSSYLNASVPDENYWGSTGDSLGNFDGHGYGYPYWAETPYAYQESRDLMSTSGLNGATIISGEFSSSSMANAPVATSSNEWAEAEGGGLIYMRVNSLVDFLISVDYNASVYGVADSYGYFEADFSIRVGQAIISDGIAGTNETISNSYSGHIEKYYTLSGGYNESDLYPWIETRVYTENFSVPEPSTMLLLGSGLIGLAGYGRKKIL